MRPPKDNSMEDLDSLDAAEEYFQEKLSLDDFKHLVGQDTARAIRNKTQKDLEIESLFDDPENF